MTTTSDDYEKRVENASAGAKKVACWVLGAWLLFGAIAAIVTIKFPRAGAGGTWFDGAYADMFGIVNALFTGMALVGLWYTIQLQHIELTRSELKSQALSMQRQADVLTKQEFEATFFQLLKRFSETTDGVIFRDTRGAHAFKTLYDTFTGTYSNQFAVDRALGRGDGGKGIYQSFLHEHSHILNHYFRNFYHVIKHVHDSHLPLAEKYRYSSIARAQLSTYEVLHLLYNGASGEGLGFQNGLKTTLC